MIYVAWQCSVMFMINIIGLKNVEV